MIWGLGSFTLEILSRFLFKSSILGEFKTIQYDILDGYCAKCSCSSWGFEVSQPLWLMGCSFLSHPVYCDFRDIRWVGWNGLYCPNFQKSIPSCCYKHPNFKLLQDALIFKHCPPRCSHINLKCKLLMLIPILAVTWFSVGKVPALCWGLFNSAVCRKGSCTLLLAWPYTRLCSFRTHTHTHTYMQVVPNQWTGLAGRDYWTGTLDSKFNHIMTCQGSPHNERVGGRTLYPHIDVHLSCFSCYKS